MGKKLQSSLFGYSKKSVVAYIAGMNEEFSKKLLDKDLECKNTIQELKDQLEQLRQENEQLQASRQEVAGALIDAKAFAAELRERAEEENTALRAKNEAYHRAEFQRLQTLAANIDALRGDLRSAINKMDAELEQYGAECQAVQAKLGNAASEDQETAVPLEEGNEALA